MHWLAWGWDGRRHSHVLCLIGALALAGGLATFPAAASDELTLKLRDTAFEVTGKLESYDGVVYVLNARGVGRVSLRADMFDCTAGPCPQPAGTSVGAWEQSLPPAGVAPGAEGGPLPAAPATRIGPGQDLGSATWYADAAAGTRLIPTLLETFAADIGATVTERIGADPRDVYFTLESGEGRNIGTLQLRRRGREAGETALATSTAEAVWAGREAQDSLTLANAFPVVAIRPAARRVASDAVVLLVSPSNPAVSLTIEDVAGIYSGRISDWSELGHPPGPINVYAPAPGLDIWSAFESAILKPRGLTLTERALRLDHPSSWADAVELDQRAISIASIAEVRRARALNIESSCGLAARPSPFTVKTGEYPLIREMTISARWEAVSPLTRRLADLALSPRFASILRQTGFPPPDVEHLSVRDQGNRIAHALAADPANYDQDLMRTLLADIRQSSRLSLTFRFEPESTRLTASSLADIARLRAYLASPARIGRKILLAGFSDTSGDFTTNLRLSAERAEAVRRVLAASPLTPGIEVVAKGYGELAPVTCNDTDIGRNLNRRVEIWVR
ncbi:MAG: phosphate ABC transporter substrate-binding/OmpA family protein [Hyphomicrobiaceae bacterium]|nr:phosphate ABC transporter substrate-binding/OmpA family protein [Hyphomicrobiaceae bacterium]